MAKKIVKTDAPTKAKKVAPAKKASPIKKLAAKIAVDMEAIRKKAEEIYYARVARGEHGTAESDWHQAEKMLKTDAKPSAKKSVAKPAAKKAVAKPAAKKAVAKKPASKKK